MANVFVSYSRQSKEVATTLASDIEALGHTVWLDQELSGGQVWWDQILATVRRCDVFVFVLDPVSLNSTACKREYGYAADLGKPILPVLVSDGISINLLPPALSQIQFIDYRRPDRDSALRLARAFTVIPPFKPLPDPLPPPPEVPVSYLGGLAEQVETTATLSYQQQSTLVVDLRRGLRDSQTTHDTRTLLKRLRKRHDLFATIADEIDELLGIPRQPPAVPPRPSVPEPPPKVETPQHTDTRPRLSRPPLMTYVRWRRALVGAVVGAVLGGITAYRSIESSGHALQAIGFTGTAGAIIGAFSGMHRRVSIIALAGFTLGLMVWMMADSQIDEFFRAVVFGGSISAILGAIVGAIISAGESPPKDTHHLPTAAHMVTLRERFLGALVGAAAVAVLGLIIPPLVTSYYRFFPQDWVEVVGAGGTAGAIFGAMSGTRRRVFVFALAGFVLGFIFYLKLVYPYRVTATLFGGSSGGISGAIIGAIMERRKSQT
jgi:hypothetical protein